MKPPVPEITPPKLALVSLFAPTVRVAVPRVTEAPAEPLSASIVSARLFRLNTPELLIVTSEVSAI